MLRFFPQKNRYVEEVSQCASDKEGQIPQHTAIIMDGDGRWARNRRLPRIARHKEGMDTVKKITKHASHLDVKALTLYVFSTESWKRPTDEVNFLMQLLVDSFNTFVPELIRKDAKVNVVGCQEFPPSHTQDVVKRTIKQTKDNTGTVLNFALNYGARAELLTAMKQIAAEVSEKTYTTDEIIEETVAGHLITGFLPMGFYDPELLIRTGGEERTSNFLLWQTAYSELFFTKALRSDFSGDTLETVIASFQNRNRRFGGPKETTETEGSDLQ